LTGNGGVGFQILLMLSVKTAGGGENGQKAGATWRK
jgi:hypothetical protein